MRKKVSIIPIAIIVLLAFGTVTSAHAIIDSVSLSAILSAGFLTLVSVSETIKRSSTKPVQGRVSAPTLKKGR